MGGLYGRLLPAPGRMGGLLRQPLGGGLGLGVGNLALAP
jgi:hypothetical protein